MRFADDDACNPAAAMFRHSFGRGAADASHASEDEIVSWIPFPHEDMI